MALGPGTRPRWPPLHRIRRCRSPPPPAVGLDAGTGPAGVRSASRFFRSSPLLPRAARGRGAARLPLLSPAGFCIRRWRREILCEGCIYCARCKRRNASGILRCVVGFSLNLYQFFVDVMGEEGKLTRIRGRRSRVGSTATSRRCQRSRRRGHRPRGRSGRRRLDL